tara:strand:+ start:494 stop:751 length:258 start_codon:yes stop_codon:yes gene_type:complete
VRQKIQRVIDEKINPMVAQHGGRIDLVDYANKTAFIKMSGGCQGCSSSKLTLQQGVERELFAAIPRIQRIVDVTDHEAGANPYYD